MSSFKAYFSVHPLMLKGGCSYKYSRPFVYIKEFYSIRNTSCNGMETGELSGFVSIISAI